MIDYIVSEQMKAYLEEQQVVFSDLEKATMVWNMLYLREFDESVLPEYSSRYSWRAILDSLQEIADGTSDEKAKRQILKRICHEEKGLAAFKDNLEGRFVYAVMEENKLECGFFMESDAAMKCAIQYDHRTYHRIINKYLLNEVCLGIGPGGEMVLDENGEILYVRSYEVERLDEWGRGRFERRFVEIPYFFEKGCQVRDILSGRYGIVALDFNEKKAVWEKLRRQRQRLDYFDSKVPVMFLGEDGRWRDEGISPLRLEAKAMSAPLSDVVGYSYACALQAFSDYWSKGGVNADAVLKYCMEYAENCRINSYIARKEEDTFYEGREVMDIIQYNNIGILSNRGILSLWKEKEMGMKPF